MVATELSGIEHGAIEVRPAPPAPRPPQPGEVVLWQLPLDLPLPAELVEWLGPAERTRALRLQSDLARDRFVTGRVLQRVVLGLTLAIDPGRLDVDQQPDHKPGFLIDGAPVTLASSYASAAGVGLLALAAAGRLGCDLEAPRARRFAQRIAARRFTPAEGAALAALDPADSLTGFLHVWTQKEALLKANGRGLADRLDAFGVDVDPLGPGGLTSGAHPYAPTDWWLRAFPLAGGHRAAVALDRPFRRVSVGRLDARELPRRRQPSRSG